MQIRQIQNYIYRQLGWLLPLFISIWFLWKGSLTPVSEWLPWFWGSMTGCAVMLLVWQIFCLIRELRASADSRMLRLRSLGAIMENLPDPTSVIYGPGDDAFPDTVKELAMLEHLRWSSAIELLGYTRGPRENHITDERRRIHHCLVPWKKLDEESAPKSSPDIHVNYKLYNLMVIYTTLNMYHQKQLK